MTNPLSLSKKLLLAVALIVAVGVIGFLSLRYSEQQEGAVATPQPMTLPITIGVIKYIPALDPYLAGFKDGMKDLGYVEGRDVTYFEESSMGNLDLTKLNDIAKRFIAQDVDVLFTFPIEASLAALHETAAALRTDIPIVAAGADAPIEQGLVKSYQSSGNNVAVVTIDLSLLTAKKLEFLKQIKPDAKKIGLFVERNSSLTSTITLRELKKHAELLGFELVIQTIEAPGGAAATAEVKEKTEAFKPGDVDAWFQIPGGDAVSNPVNFAMVNQMAKRLKIPVIGTVESRVRAGALFTYAHNLYSVGKQSSVIADKIIKGTAPSSIPVEFNLENDLVVNLKTAKEIGVTIPQNILSIAKIINE